MNKTKNLKHNFDFRGYATRNDILCSDGRTIRRDAFKHNDRSIVPLVWMHCHNDPENVLGQAYLENRDNGVYAYCAFNETTKGQHAKMLVEHGDICAMSIFANRLKQRGGDVLHGDIKEVSLVIAGANPGALIEEVVQHDDEEGTFSAMIFTNEDDSIEFAHSDEEGGDDGDDNDSDDLSHADGKTMGEIYDTLNDEQLAFVYSLIKMVEGKDDSKEGSGEGTAVSHADGETTMGEIYDSFTDEQKLFIYALIEELKKEEPTMKHNVFDNRQDDANMTDTLSHEDMTAVLGDMKRYGSLKESALAHGITNIDYLFPDAVNLNKTPDFISREMDWVKDLLNSVHHTPFSRVKSTFADITEDEARAKGYMKGNRKKDEVFSLLKRVTNPTTIYKKQKLDRDDVIDITDFDVVAWMKTEMRMMLDEEIARAVLIGDGRLSDSEDKIPEDHIRPVWKDDPLYCVKVPMTVKNTATGAEKAKNFIRSIIKARKQYKGSGNPVLYMTEDMLTECLLLEDTTGRIIYDSEQKLATTLRVRKIVTPEVMDNQTREDKGTTYELMGLLFNPVDYNIGADKGGAVNLFDDFDLNFNAQLYLIETRCSGALTKPMSALAIELPHAASASEPDGQG